MGSAHYTDEEIARLKAKCASLTRENECLRERLEVGYYWTSKDGGPLERAPVPESVDIPDGISCRDETIKLQDERIATLTRERDEARAEVAGWRECALYDAMMDGPRFKGWDRSALDRMRRRAEQDLACQPIPPSTPVSSTAAPVSDAAAETPDG